MKRLIFMAVATVTMLTAANAKVWRINPEENAKADFNTLKAACEHVSVASGDTLYLEPGYYNSDNIIAREGMTVLGPGWGFAPAYGNTTTIEKAQLTSQLKIQANNTHVEGIVITYSAGTQISCSNSLQNITIERCNFGSSSISYNSISAIDAENIIIRNNCIRGVVSLSSGSMSSSKLNNVSIIGNIILRSNHNAIQIDGRTERISNVTIQNNTIIGNFETNYTAIQTYNSLIQDNIILNTANTTWVMKFDYEGNIIRKNIFSLSALNATASISEKYPDNYYIGATVADVIKAENGVYNFEEYYQLKDDSPAKGAAYDGGDCGAFGGTKPYIICGRPYAIPYIYDVEVPAHPTDNKLTVTFKVTGQHE